MRTLSNVFKWAGGIILAAGLICGGVFANDAKSGSFLIFLYWAVGGGLACMFLLAYGYFLEVAADIKDQMEDNELEALLKSHLSRKHENVQQPGSQQAATQNTAAISAQRETYRPTVQTTAKSSIKVPDADYVVCDKCGYEQRNNRTICYNCGAPLSAESAQQVIPSPSSAHTGYIVCPRCGMEQRENRKVCYECGAVFSDASESAGKGV